MEEGKLTKRVKVNDDYVDDLVMGLDLARGMSQHKADVDRAFAISHITLLCKNIEKTALFLKEIFGAIEYYSTNETVFSLSKEKFFKINGQCFWVCLFSLLMPHSL